MSSQCTDLVIQDDTILENSENFTISLSSQSSEVNINSGRQQATVTINEDNVDSKWCMTQILSSLEDHV